jgi:hypothetical protein
MFSRYALGLNIHLKIYRVLFFYRDNLIHI